MRTIFCLAAISLVSGCCDKDDLACKREEATARASAYVTNPVDPVNAATPDKRVTVVRIDAVADSLAYGGVRGVYVIKDAKTGDEFIGVSGVGIAATGSHKSGKTTVTDER